MTESLKEGTYYANASLKGGSGKADITSPVKLSVAQNGTITAEIEWSSPNYDYMRALDKEYYPVNNSGNSLFLIELQELPDELPVTAETLAMSKPHMIDYTIAFDTASLHAAASPSYSIFTVCAVIAVVAAAAIVLRIKISSRKSGSEKN